MLFRGRSQRCSPIDVDLISTNGASEVRMTENVQLGSDSQKSELE